MYFCFRPHKSSTTRDALTYFCSEVGSGQDRWIQFQIMSILGINGGTGIPVYPKKGRGERGGPKLFWNYDSGCVQRRVFRASFCNIPVHLVRIYCGMFKFYWWLTFDKIFSSHCMLCFCNLSFMRVTFSSLVFLLIFWYGPIEARNCA